MRRHASILGSPIPRFAATATRCAVCSRHGVRTCCAGSGFVRRAKRSRRPRPNPDARGRAPAACRGVGAKPGGPERDPNRRGHLAGSAPQTRFQVARIGARMFGFERFIHAATGIYDGFCSIVPVDTHGSVDTLEKLENGFISDGFHSAAHVETASARPACNRSSAPDVVWCDARRPLGGPAAPTTGVFRPRPGAPGEPNRSNEQRGRRGPRNRLSERMDRSRGRRGEGPNPRRKGTRGMSRLFGRTTRSIPGLGGDAGRDSSALRRRSAAGLPGLPEVSGLARFFIPATPVSRRATRFRSPDEAKICARDTPPAGRAATHRQTLRALPGAAAVSVAGIRPDRGPSLPRWKKVADDLRIAAQPLQYWTGEGWEDPDCARKFAFG